MSVADRSFSEVFKDVSSGNTKVPKSDYLTEGAFPVIDQGKSEIAGFTDDEDALFKKTDLPVIVFGDHTRCVKYVDHPFAMGADGVKVLKANAGLDPRFTYHALRNLRLADAGYDRHFKYLKRSSFPIVGGEEEQKRIAAILDKADAIRRKRQQALRLTDDFLRSVFLDMFGDPVTNPKGWEETTAGEELEFLTSGSRGWAKYYADEGDLFIRIQNLRGGILDLSDAAYVDAPDSAEAKRTRVQPGDVLLSITADLGRTAVVPEGIGKAHINQHLAILRLESLNPVFVSHLLATPGGQSQFVTLNRSAVKAGLNFDDVRSIRLFRPPPHLQNQFASIVEKVTDFGERLKDSSLLTGDAFLSLQQRAFRGEL